MWELDNRWKAYYKAGGTGAVVCGIIVATYGWYFFDPIDPALFLWGVVGWYFYANFQWSDAATNGLVRIESKLDDIESKLDELESKPDNSNEQLTEMDY